MTRILSILFVFLTCQVFAQPTEEMEYIIRFGIIKGGHAELSGKMDKLNNEPVIHYHLKGKTTGITDKLFAVYDIYDSYVDPKTHLPKKAIRNVKEQKYKYYNEVIFDRQKDSLYSTRSGAKKVLPNTNDLIGVFFYMRQDLFLDELRSKELYEIPVYHADEYFTMKMKYLGTDTINTILGPRNCHVVAPIIKVGKLLKRSDGLKLYITADEQRVPVYMELDMRIGYLKCILDKYLLDGVDQASPK